MVSISLYSFCCIMLYCSGWQTMAWGLFLYSQPAKNVFIYFLKGCKNKRIKTKKKNMQLEPYVAFKT